MNDQIFYLTAIAHIRYDELLDEARKQLLTYDTDQSSGFERVSTWLHTLLQRARIRLAVLRAGIPHDTSLDEMHQPTSS